MFQILQDRPVLLVLLALLPVALSWWPGRTLTARASDPALPERLHAHHQRTSLTATVVAALLALTAVHALIWTLPLLVLGLLAAAHPLRRAVLAETWSLPAYLSFFIRLLSAWGAFWILLAAVPALTRLAGAFDWLAGGLLAAVLLLWNARFADVFRACLRTEPLGGSPLLERCRTLAGACGLPEIRFERVDLRGGVVANALALASRRGSSVVFTSTLLERLTEDEAVAIAGHELAHLEHFTPRLRLMNTATTGLIVLAAVWTPLLRVAAVQPVALAMVLWLAVVATVLALRARGRQHQETACDTRAVELTGDPEALVGALTALHAIARLPRRFDAQRERSSTHPSLARRIRDIRRAGGIAAPSLDKATSVRAADGRGAVTFDGSGVRWQESEAVITELRYGGLTELRLDAPVGGLARLIAVGQDTRRRQMPVAAADIDRLQQVLDIVDGALGEASVRPFLPRPAARVFIAIGLAAVLAAGQVAAGLVACLALIRPSASSLLAAALAALTAAAILLRDPVPGSVAAVCTAAVVASGFALLLLAWRGRAGESGGSRFVDGALAVGAALALALLFVDGFSAAAVHMRAVSSGTAPIMAVAAAGSLAASRTRRARLLAAVAATGAALSTAAGTPAVLDLVSRDPFLVRAQPLSWAPVDPVGLQIALPDDTSRVVLSTDASHVALIQQADHEGDGRLTFHVGPTGGRLTPLRAGEVVFTDAVHVVALDAGDEGATIRLIDVRGGGEEVRRWHVQDVRTGSLSVDPVSKRWALTGWDSRQALVTVSADTRGDAFDERRWPPLRSPHGYVSAAGTVPGGMVAVESRHVPGLLDGWASGRAAWALMPQPYRERSRYWKLEPDGRHRLLGESELGAACGAGPAGGDAIACSVFDGTRTRLLGISLTGVRPIASLPGRFVSDGAPGAGWLTGWSGAWPIAIDLASARAYRAPPDTFATQLAVAGPALAALTLDGDGMKLILYRTRLSAVSSQLSD